MTSLQQFLPANTMLPPPDFVNKTAQVATVAAAVDRQTGRFFRIVVYSTILFFILSYPATYRVVNHLYYLISNKNNEIVGEDGCASLKGCFVHSVVFGILMIYIVSK